MMDAIRLFYSFAKVTFLTQLEYRAMYAIRMLGKVLAFGSGFALIAILLARFGQIGDWTTYEVLLLYALNVLCYSLGATFAMPVNDISSRISAGQIDSILTKPVNSLLLYVCQNVSAGYTSNYVISLGIMAVCFTQLQITITFFKVFWLILSILGGSLIHAAGLIVSGVPSFWLIKGYSVPAMLYVDFRNFVDYPLSIYSGVIRFILTFLLPYGFINFYPAQMFLSRGDTPFFPALQYLTPVVGIACFALAYWFWKKGLDAYQSSGS